MLCPGHGLRTGCLQLSPQIPGVRSISCPLCMSSMDQPSLLLQLTDYRAQLAEALPTFDATISTYTCVVTATGIAPKGSCQEFSVEELVLQPQPVAGGPEKCHLSVGLEGKEEQTQIATTPC